MEREGALGGWGIVVNHGCIVVGGRVRAADSRCRRAVLRGVPRVLVLLKLPHLVELKLLPTDHLQKSIDLHFLLLLHFLMNLACTGVS